MRWLVRILIALFVVAALALGAWFLIPTARIAQFAAARFEAATGRQMVIAGGLHPTLWPEFGIRADKVEIANAAWAKDGPMLRARALEIAVDPGVLLGGAVHVRRIVLRAPELRLERARNGAVNWEFGAAGAPPSAPSSAAPAAESARTGTERAPAGSGSANAADGGAFAGFSLADARISDGQVIWVDRSSGTTHRLSGINGQFRLPRVAGPAEFKLRGTAGGRSVVVNGQVERFDRFASGVPDTLSVTVVAGGSRVAFSGRVGLSPFALSGGVDAHLPDLGAVFAALGQKAPALPEGLGRRLIAVRGQLDYGRDAVLRLTKAAIQLDGNRLSGDVALATTGSRPRISAKLNAAALQLGPKAAAGGRGGSADAQAGEGWSRAPIDTAPLRAIDAELTLRVAALDLGAVQLGRSDIGLHLRDGAARLSLDPVRAYKGRITGTLTADARRGLVVGGDVTMADVALQPLLADLANYHRLIGTGTLALKWRGTGDTPDRIMRSLSGSGSLDIGRGELQGLDLAGMLTHLDLNYMGPGAKTIFDAISAGFTIRDGVLENRDLTLRAPLLSAAGAGTVDLGARRLDYVITPTALKGAAGGRGISVPLKITGPWAAPRLGLDMQAGGVRKARDALRRALEQRLGIAPQPPAAGSGGAGAGAPSAGTAPGGPAPAGSGGTAGGGTGASPGGGGTTPAPVDPRKALEDAARRQLLKMLGGGN